jgi:hypothetical protein
MSGQPPLQHDPPHRTHVVDDARKQPTHLALLLECRGFYFGGDEHSALTAWWREP